MADKWVSGSNPGAVDAPARRAISVTPSDVDALTDITRAVYVGGAGNLAVVMADNVNPVTFSGVPAGTTLRIRVKQVMNTSTTATLILALY